jgi:hypothetical protein
MNETQMDYGLPEPCPFNAFYATVWRYTSEDGQFPVTEQFREMFIEMQNIPCITDLQDDFIWEIVAAECLDDERIMKRVDNMITKSELNAGWEGEEP